MVLSGSTLISIHSAYFLFVGNIPLVMESSSSSLENWVSWYLRQTNSEYLVDIEEDFYLDKFNLTGLQSILHFPICYDILTDNSEIQEYSEHAHELLERSTRHLYGMIHARYVLTLAGLRKIATKVKSGLYGYCHRDMCPKTPLIPVGISNKPYVGHVKGYCGHCQDIYNTTIPLDGAYYSDTLPHLLLMTYPDLIPESPCSPFDFVVYGFHGLSIKEMSDYQNTIREMYRVYWRR